MPVYEYQCKACDHEFEREQRMSDAPVKKCPECGAMKAKRLISLTSFVLKGGGWYNDLYSSTGKGNAKKDAGDSEAKPSGGDAKESKSTASGDTGSGGAGDAGSGGSGSGDSGSGDTKSKKTSSGKSGGKPKGSKAA